MILNHKQLLVERTTATVVICAATFKGLLVHGSLNPTKTH